MKKKNKKASRQISLTPPPPHHPLMHFNPIVLHLQQKTLQLQDVFMLKYDCTAGALPLCLAKYRPRTMSAQRMANITTATTPPMTAWSIFCGAPSPALESENRTITVNNFMISKPSQPVTKLIPSDRRGPHWKLWPLNH